MLKNEFIHMVREPRNIDSARLPELESIVKEYPFFESAHLLYTKGLHTSNALNYSRQLRKTAIIANSRAVLYELLHGKEIAKELPVAEAIVTKPLLTEVTQNSEKVITEPEQVEQPVAKPNPVTITNSDIKVVYVTTVPTVNEPLSEKEQQSFTEPQPLAEIVPPVETISQDPVQEEINIIQTIENETEVPTQEFDENELNRSIGKEIGRSVIQSYVETELIKTPELQKEEPKQPLSFTDWLNRVKTESGSLSKTEVNEQKQSPEPEKPVEKAQKEPKIEKKASNLEQNKNIIDKIIESDPGRIRLGASKFFTPASDAKQSLLENEHLVTETLAKIYALQGNISKAIRAYEILSLKFPQKSVYFASLIEKLKK